jgi:soluble lytic murein transglycosylase
LSQEKIEQAQRMLVYLKLDEQAWAKARIALVRNKPELQGSLSAVPERLLKTPGLHYDRLKRLRKLEKDEAFPLFLAISKREGDRSLWWTERKILSRRALTLGKPALAYKIMHGHGFKEGEEFAEAEWFLGWLALSFLHKPQIAIRHFEAFYRGVRTPLSRSKAAYWAGRASEHLRNATQARAWYQRGAQAVTSYYGQLSLQKLKIAPHNLRPDSLQISLKQRQSFSLQEIPQIIRLLGSAGAEKLILEFSYVYAKKASSQSDRHLMLDLIHEVAPHYVVAIAKQAERTSPMLVERAYPTLKHFGLKSRLPVEPAFAHAVIRQESDFNPKAVSGPGAQGLTQLMPETARMIATKLNMPYRSQALIHDPAYNLKLGMAYLADRLGRYEGSYVLALASYNAGSGRVQEWVKNFGDPRQPGIDVINWIERIPYSETRTYIHRVMANLYIYRNIFNKNF